MNKPKRDPKEVRSHIDNNLSRGEKRLCMWACDEAMARQIYAYRARLVRKWKEQERMKT